MITAWRVENYRLFFMHRTRRAISQVAALLCTPARSAIPSISPRHTQAPRCCAQVIHTVVHSNPAGLMIEFAAARTYHGAGRGL